MQSNDDFNDFEKHWKYLHRFYISLFSQLFYPSIVFQNHHLSTEEEFIFII